MKVTTTNGSFLWPKDRQELAGAYDSVAVGGGCSVCSSH